MLVALASSPRYHFANSKSARTLAGRRPGLHRKVEQALMPDVKLIALDAEDLAVISAHLQDAVVSVGDMAYLKTERRFALLANRFDWEQATGPGNMTKAFARRRAGLRFECVEVAKIAGIDLKKPKDILSLLAIEYEEGEAPAGFVTLRFSGGAAIRLQVECIEAELKDLGAAWATKKIPEHSDDSSSKSS